MAELLPTTEEGVGLDPNGDQHLPGVCGSPALDRGMALSFLYLKISEVVGGVFNGVGAGAEEEQEEGEQLQRSDR